jgi:hypothetical protein
MARFPLGFVLGLLAASALVPSAHAVPVPFSGVLRLQVRALSFEVAGSGIAEVDSISHPSRISIPQGAFAAQGIVVPVPTSIQASAFPVVALQVTIENEAGAFLASAGGLGGAMPLLGVAKVCLFATCSAAVANVSVPLAVVGVGGDSTVQGPVNVTVEGAPWTTNATVTGFRTVSSPFTVMGSRRAPASKPNSTAAPSGQIQLVTPIFVSTNLAGEPTVATFAALTLHFVPEPGTLFLLAIGVAGLALSAIHRSRESRRHYPPSCASN